MNELLNQISWNKSGCYSLILFRSHHLRCNSTLEVILEVTDFSFLLASNLHFN